MFRKKRFRKGLQKAAKKLPSGLSKNDPNKTYIQMWMDEGLNSTLIKPMLDDLIISLGPFGALTRSIKRKTGRGEKIKLPNSLMEKVWFQAKKGAKGKDDVGALDLYLEQALEQSAFIVKKVTQPMETLNEYLQARGTDIGAISSIASAQKAPQSQFELAHSDEKRAERDKKKLGLFF
jgi:hypothetical protein